MSPELVQPEYVEGGVVITVLGLTVWAGKKAVEWIALRVKADEHEVERLRTLVEQQATHIVELRVEVAVLRVRLQQLVDSTDDDPDAITSPD